MSTFSQQPNSYWLVKLASIKVTEVLSYNTFVLDLQKLPSQRGKIFAPNLEVIIILDNPF